MTSKIIKKQFLETKELSRIAMCAVLIALCSWISIPFIVPFTMQTFAISLALIILGGRNGTISILIYLLIGAIGVPVFANFSSGIGSLLGTTGGYLIGFLFMGAVYGIITYFLGVKKHIKFLALILGTIVCYSFGTFWFLFVYNSQNSPIGLATALTWCVFPYIIPDIIKIIIAFIVGESVKKYGL